jgi:diadenosine tetraphosphate (Ap4A) HIT family hydrolase
MNCLSCTQYAQLAELPPRDRIHVGTHWRIAHGWSALPGWLIVIAQRHVAQFSELTSEEATELGSLLREASAALSAALGCVKTYVVSYGEQPGFEHLHLHVVPRMADFEAHQVGSGVFQLLKCPESEWVAPAERDQLSVALARHWTPGCSPVPFRATMRGAIK